ncbi:thymidine phosphorylase [Microbacterium nanhaiense]|uniref:Thymidine phosphorylase n=1 Tax=Microbacterium nanhaiense TaxID=1301026 RepID=A0ABQ2N1H5_9MICO|nr:thymidine phosphorylase [Microbacterium nanhaiense]GGO62772.1 thymidine phosphorylase [Microbacterium nanhaiense]
MAEPFDAVDIIRIKRDGGSVPEPALRWLIDAYTREYVQDAQMSAFTMAVLLNGMTRDEIRVMTDAMIASGERMSFAGLGKRTADKHSTGGVGDKITLPLAPLVAAYGVAVPQLSGRGLGHTGGTLDKLESIPGWRAALSNEEMFAQMQGPVGAVICAAGSGLAPADKRLYALRDVTGTVEAIPLIASSIMSKKIAEGTESLVLDVKFGSGAFMKDYAKAKELAETMVALGTDSGVNTTALLTDMSTPLGLTAGNANEVRESVEVLAGGGPADVVELTVALAREMLQMSGIDEDPAEALRDGRAMDVWRAMIRAQDGDPDAPLPSPKETHVVTADRDGVMTRLDAYDVGIAAWRLGAGRARAQDPVVHAAGIDMHAKPGDSVRKGDPLFTLNADDPARFDRALDALAGSYEIGDAAPDVAPIVRERIAAA